MKFVMVLTYWVMVCAGFFSSCGGKSVTGVEDATFVEWLGEVKIVCLYGIRYGLASEGTLVPLLGDDSWPLPCEDRTPETCEKKLLQCQTDRIVDQTTLRELEDCDGLNEFIDRCIGGDGSGVRPTKPNKE